MKPMPMISVARIPGGKLPLAVLLLGLGATLFATWREREVRRQAKVIQWQEGFGQMQPIFSSALSQRFETLRDQAKLTLRREGVSNSSWNHFLELAEWRQRFPGMMELGYAELDGERCVIKFLDGRQSPPPHEAGFDLSRDPTIHDAV